MSIEFDSLKTGEKVNFGVSIEHQNNNNGFVFSGDKPCLLINIKQNCLSFDSHFCSRRCLLWVPILNKEGCIKNIDALLSKNSILYLFVKIKSQNEYIYIDKIDIKNIYSDIFFKEKEQGKLYENKFFYIQLQNELTLDLWEEIGWDINENWFCDGLQIPKKLLLIIRDNSWKKFIKPSIKRLYSDGKIYSEYVQYSPLYLWLINDPVSTNNFRRFYESLCGTLEKPYYKENTLYKDKTVDSSRLLCFGFINKGSNLALYYPLNGADPEIYVFYGIDKKIANNINEFEKKLVVYGEKIWKYFPPHSR